MGNPTIPSTSSLAKTKFANEVMEGHLRANPLAPIMRPNGMNAIILTEKVSIGDGMSYQVGFTDEISIDSWKSGNNRVSGTGEDLRLSTDTITLGRDRVAIQVSNITESALRTGVQLPETAKRRLQRAAASKVAYGLLSAMCDVTAGRTANRYLYGSDEANYNATHATALANVDNTDDKCTLAMLDLAKEKAQNQTSGRAYINPASFQPQSDGAIIEKYVVLLHYKAGRDLKKDPDFKNLVNFKDKPVFNVINGGTYIGEYNDMLIYVVPSFYKPTTANPNPMIAAAAGAAGIDVAHNLLLGANAAALAYGDIKLMDDGTGKGAIMRSTAETDGSVLLAVTAEVSDHYGNGEMAVTMVPGYKKLVDSSSGTAEDAGVVHFFSAAV